MAEKETVILDISSDEDVCWRDSVSASSGDGGGGCRDDDDWISELLEKVDKETDDSDEVVVVGEVIAKPKPKFKLRVAKPLVQCANKAAADDDDDDCVVLYGNPDEPVAVQNDKREDDPDELLVVSEKGQVACRDYPHARHLCVNFPFNSTPHDRHCDQCHCYVCDSLAPCLHWSTGISSIDHCHATDKDEFWKAQRKSSKKNDKLPPVPPAVPDSSFSVDRAPPLPSVPPLQNQLLFTQAANQLSCVSSGNGTQSNSMHGRGQHSERTYNCYYSKRARTFGDVLPANRCSNNSSSKASHGYQSAITQDPKTRWLDPSFQVNVGGTATRMSSSPAISNMANGTANYLPSHPQMFPQTHGSSINSSTVGPQHQFSSQLYTNFSFTSLMPTQPAAATQPNWGCPSDNSFPFQPQSTSDLSSTRISQDPVPSEFQVSSWSNMSNCCESGLSKPHSDGVFENPLLHIPQVCGQTASLSNHGEGAFKQVNQTQSTVHPSSAEFGFSWDPSPRHSQQPVAVEHNRLANAVQRDEAAVNVDIGSHLPVGNNSYPSEFHFDPWMFENQPGLGALEVPAPPELNIFSPEAAPVDVGVLFDL